MNSEKIKDFLNLIRVMNSKLDYGNQVNFSDFENDILRIAETNEMLFAKNNILQAQNEALERELLHLNSQTVDSIEKYEACKESDVCTKKRGRKKQVNLNELLNENENEN